MAFDPASLIVGSGGFWRADRSVVLSGSSVTQWGDQSSFGNNLVLGQSPFPTSPSFGLTAVKNAFPGVIFTNSGSQGLGASLTFTAGAGCSVFVLAYTGTTLAPAGAAIMGFNAPGQNVLGANSFYINDAVTPIRMVGAGNSVTTNFFPTATSSLYLLVGTFDGVNQKTFNGTTLLNSAANSVVPGGAGAGSVINLGTETAGGGAMNFACGFFGLTQKALTSTDLSNLASWSDEVFGSDFANLTPNDALLGIPFPQHMVGKTRIRSYLYPGAVQPTVVGAVAPPPVTPNPLMPSQTLLFM